VVGSIGTFAFSVLMSPTHFIAAPAQLAVAALIVVTLAVLAFRFRRPVWTSAPGNAWAGFALGLGMTTVFQVLFRESQLGSPWLMVGLMLGLEAAAVPVILRLRPAAFPLAAGALLTYCWLGMTVAVQAGLVGTIEQSALVVAAVVLLTLAARRKAEPVTLRARADTPIAR
jgi:hypothetical protein